MQNNQFHFSPGQTYLRFPPKGKTLADLEHGEVRDVAKGRVIMAVTSHAGRITGIETFSPAHDLGWRLCG